MKDIRKHFPNLNVKVNSKPLVYFDNASTTFKPKSVIDLEVNYYSKETANVHRGVHYLSQISTDKYEEVRKKIRKFINAEDSCQIIFTKGTTDSINLLAYTMTQSIKKDDEIIISEMEHHSNIVPWQMLCERTGAKLKVIPINDDGELMIDEYEKLLNEKTKIVSVVYISNSLGTINPVKKVIELAHKNNAICILDCAQAMAHTKVDVQELDVDFIALSSHKMYGPTGVGVLYGKKKLLEELPPFEGGGDMIKKVTFEETIYNDIPYKFEAGTPNIAGVISSGAAIDFINEIGFEKIKSIEEDLLNYATEKLSEIEGLKIYGTSKNKIPIISFTLEGIHPHDIGSFADNDGIAIRTGHHCTQPVMDRYNIPATARASLTVYNTKEEIDKLVESIKNMQKVFK